jgi:hypothetical protein
MAEKKGIPYEATFITHFSLRLGVEVARNAGLSVKPPQGEAPDSALGPEGSAHVAPGTIPIAVTSHQGTSHDKSMGDLLTAVHDQGVLVEFKRDLNGWVDEAGKPHKKAVLEKLAGSEWEPVSRIAHWFAYGTGPWRGTAPDILLAPYLALLDGRDSISAQAEGLDVFFERLLMPRDGNSSEKPPHSDSTRREPIGAPFVMFEKYLAEVRRLTEGGAADDNVAGILLLFDDDGYLRHVPFLTISDLGESLAMIARGDNPVGSTQATVESTKAARWDPATLSRLQQALELFPEAAGQEAPIEEDQANVAEDAPAISKSSGKTQK